MIKFEFDCLTEGCDSEVRFSQEGALGDKEIVCPGCGRTYSLPPELREKVRLLDGLIRDLRRARPILGRTSVVIDLEGHQVKIPYYLLLTRLTSELALDLEGEDLKLRCLATPFSGENGAVELDIGKK